MRGGGLSSLSLLDLLTDSVCSVSITAKLARGHKWIQNPETNCALVRILKVDLPMDSPAH